MWFDSNGRPELKRRPESAKLDGLRFVTAVTNPESCFRITISGPRGAIFDTGMSYGRGYVGRVGA